MPQNRTLKRGSDGKFCFAYFSTIQTRKNSLVDHGNYSFLPVGGNVKPNGQMKGLKDVFKPVHFRTLYKIRNPAPYLPCVVHIPPLSFV